MDASDEVTERTGKLQRFLIPLVILISLALDSVVTVYYWGRIDPDYATWFWGIFILTAIPYSVGVRVEKALDRLEVALEGQMASENEAECLSATRTLRVETQSLVIMLLLAAPLFLLFFARMRSH